MLYLIGNQLDKVFQDKAQITDILAEKAKSIYLLYTKYTRGIQMPNHHHPVPTIKPVKQPKHWLYKYYFYAGKFTRLPYKSKCNLSIVYFFGNLTFVFDGNILVLIALVPDYCLPFWNNHMSI